MSETPAAVGPAMEQWFVVDHGRIVALPARLKALWPRELLPGTAEGDESAARTKVGDAADDTLGEPAATSAGDDAFASGRIAATTTSAGDDAFASAEAGTEAVVLTSSGRAPRREVDVLSAWLAGFAAELGLSRSRMTIVISSGIETVHLAVCLGGDVGRSILSLRGEGFEEFAGCQLLRRVDIRELGQVVNELSGLVERDCVLTLTFLSAAAEAGMELLHRVDGTWFRPVIERVGGSVTVGAEAEAGERAVPALLTSVLSHLWTSTLGNRP